MEVKTSFLEIFEGISCVFGKTGTFNISWKFSYGLLHMDTPAKSYMPKLNADMILSF